MFKSTVSLLSLLFISAQAHSLSVPLKSSGPTPTKIVKSCQAFVDTDDHTVVQGDKGRSKDLATLWNDHKSRLFTALSESTDPSNVNSTRFCFQEYRLISDTANGLINSSDSRR